MDELSIGLLLMIVSTIIVTYLLTRRYVLLKIFKPGTGKIIYSGREGIKECLLELDDYYYARIIERKTEAAFISHGSGYRNEGGHYISAKIEYWPKPKSEK